MKHIYIFIEKTDKRLEEFKKAFPKATFVTDDDVSNQIVTSINEALITSEVALIYTNSQTTLHRPNNRSIYNHVNLQVYIDNAQHEYIKGNKCLPSTTGSRTIPSILDSSFTFTDTPITQQELIQELTSKNAPNQIQTSAITTNMQQSDEKAVSDNTTPTNDSPILAPLVALLGLCSLALGIIGIFSQQYVFAGVCIFIAIVFLVLAYGVYKEKDEGDYLSQRDAVQQENLILNETNAPQQVPQTNEQKVLQQSQQQQL